MHQSLSVMKFLSLNSLGTTHIVWSTNYEYTNLSTLVKNPEKSQIATNVCEITNYKCVKLKHVENSEICKILLTLVE